MENRQRKSGGRKRSPLLFGITFRAILVVAAAAMFLSYIAVYVNPAKFSLPLFFGLYFIPLFAINLLLLLAAVLRRSASAWITVVALLPSLLYTELFFKIGHEEKVDTEGIRLKIESYNAGMFSSSDNGLSREECRREIGKHFAETLPDIICLQEFFAESHTQADTIFGSYPHRHYHMFKARNGKLFGNIILSKFPIAEKGHLSFKGSTNLAIYADIEHYGRTIRVYNNHLESYNVSFTALAHKAAGMLRESADLAQESQFRLAGKFRKESPSKENLSTEGHREESDAGKETAVHKDAAWKETAREELTRDIVETHEKMRGTFIRRSQQVERIIGHINETPHQTIICGDFNDTPMSYTYHTLAKNRKDTFKEAGKGFGATFVPVWPLLRIDYLLVPEDSQCITHTIHRSGLSDHYPVSAEIII